MITALKASVDKAQEAEATTQKEAELSKRNEELQQSAAKAVNQQKQADEKEREVQQVATKMAAEAAEMQAEEKQAVKASDQQVIKKANTDKKEQRLQQDLKAAKAQVEAKNKIAAADKARIKRQAEELKAVKIKLEKSSKAQERTAMQLRNHQHQQQREKQDEKQQGQFLFVRLTVKGFTKASFGQPSMRAFVKATSASFQIDKSQITSFSVQQSNSTGIEITFNVAASSSAESERIQRAVYDLDSDEFLAVLYQNGLTDATGVTVEEVTAGSPKQQKAASKRSKSQRSSKSSASGPSKKVTTRGGDDDPCPKRYASGAKKGQINEAYPCNHDGSQKEKWNMKHTGPATQWCSTSEGKAIPCPKTKAGGDNSVTPKHEETNRDHSTKDTQQPAYPHTHGQHWDMEHTGPAKKWCSTPAGTIPCALLQKMMKRKKSQTSHKRQSEVGKRS